jgi:hypothetical protein
MATEGVAGSERCLAALLVVRVGFLGEELLHVVQTGAFRCSRTGSRTVFVRCSYGVRPLFARCPYGVRSLFARCPYGARSLFGPV